MTEKQLRDYWNNKWEKKSVIYTSRTLPKRTTEISTDVRSFICANDDIVKELIEKYDLKKKTYNETAHACQKFVVDFLTYTDDETNDGAEEFWQFPCETIASRLGDCEDGAILMASLMINAGIPNWRVKVAAGTVQPQPTAPLGGHAYCIYLADRADETKEWEIHDWCYFEDSAVPTGKKYLAKDGGYKGVYKDIWFTFNNQYAWSNEISKVEGRVKD